MATVAEIVAKTLRAYGTENYFCLTGGDHDLWVALADAGIRIVNCRNEASNVSPMTIPKMRGIVGIFALAQTKPNTPKIAVMIT